MKLKLQLLSLLLCILSLSIQAKGSYFAKKSYTPEALPTYNESKAAIPIPVLDGDKELLEMYWKSWEIGFTHLRQPQEGSPFVSNYWDEAFSPAIFQWDMIFMTHFTKYIHHIFPSINSLDNFYCRQNRDGFICREIFESNGKEFFYKGKENSVNPPLFAWSEIVWYKMTGNKERLSLVLPVLEKYAAYLEEGRKAKETPHKLFWQTSLGSGMDNTPRYGRGWVDISSQIVISYKAMIEIATILDKSDAAERFTKRADEISKAIQSYMWNEKTGLYHDVDSAGKQTKYQTIAGFWPLLAQIPTEKQAAQMVETLLDTARFNRTFPFASLAATHDEFEPEGGYWRGGSWPPVSYMAVKGMNNYGFHKQSYEQSLKLLRAMNEVYKKSGTIWEFYAADTLTHGKLLHKRTVANKTKEAKADFIGWSALGPVAMLIENIIGIECNAITNTVTWRVQRSDRHGIENLQFGDNQVSLLFSQEETGEYRIEGSCQKPFTLTTIHNGRRESYTIAKSQFAICSHLSN